MKSLPDAKTLHHLIETIEATPPRPHHSGVLATLGQVIPDVTFRHVLSIGGWYRTGGVIGGDGSYLGREIEAWMDKALAECDDDFSQFVERYADAGLLVSRHTGRTHYFIASYGPAAEEFLQLEVEELQEVLDRKLIDPDQPPEDREELLEPFHRVKVDSHPIGSSHYRFVRLVDIREVVARQRAPVGEISPLARFMSEWSESRAAEDDQFCDHWVIKGLEQYDPAGTTPFTALPMSLHSHALKPFHWDMTKSGAELSNQIRDFDRAAGYPSAWYFHVVASKLAPATLTTALKGDLDNGYDYLADKDLGLLKKLDANPYSMV